MIRLSSLIRNPKKKIYQMDGMIEKGIDWASDVNSAEVSLTSYATHKAAAATDMFYTPKIASFDMESILRDC